MQDIKMETFLAVCEYQNFTRAADALGLTQPAVSRQMKSLEEYYQVPLFHFEGKKFSLTPAGEVLKRYASTAQNDERHLMEILKQPAPKTLSLGSTPTPGEFMLPGILSSYLKKFPHRKIHISIHNTESLLEMLDNGLIDLAVVEGNFPKNEYAHLVFSVQDYVPICASSLRLPGGSMESLLEQTLILREPGSGNRKILEHCLKSHNLTPADFPAIIETNDLKVQKALVREGLGVAFVFRTAILPDDGLTVIPLDGFPLKHEMNMVWRKGSVFHEEYLKTARYFADCSS